MRRRDERRRPADGRDPAPEPAARAFAVAVQGAARGGQPLPAGQSRRTITSRSTRRRESLSRTEPRAAAAHWRYVWAGYIRRRPDAADRLREHLTLFPTHSTAACGALFPGPAGRGQTTGIAAARAYFSKLAELFPNYYYGLLAQKKLAETASGGSAALVQDQRIPEQRFIRAKAATPARWSRRRRRRSRIERAHLLRAAGSERPGRSTNCASARGPAASRCCWPSIWRDPRTPPSWDCAR